MNSNKEAVYNETDLTYGEADAAFQKFTKAIDLFIDQYWDDLITIYEEFEDFINNTLSSTEKAGIAICGDQNAFITNFDFESFFGDDGGGDDGGDDVTTTAPPITTTMPMTTEMTTTGDTETTTTTPFTTTSCPFNYTTTTPIPTTEPPQEMGKAFILNRML